MSTELSKLKREAIEANTLIKLLERNIDARISRNNELEILNGKLWERINIKENKDLIKLLLEVEKRSKNKLGIATLEALQTENIEITKLKLQLKELEAENDKMVDDIEYIKDMSLEMYKNCGGEI
jgi:hypothetical protein